MPADFKAGALAAVEISVGPQTRSTDLWRRTAKPALIPERSAVLITEGRPGASPRAGSRVSVEASTVVVVVVSMVAAVSTAVAVTEAAVTGNLVPLLQRSRSPGNQELYPQTIRLSDRPR